MSVRALRRLVLRRSTQTKKSDSFVGAADSRRSGRSSPQKAQT